MSLARFEREHRDEILAAWETFARELPSIASMDLVALRQHAGDMLDVIVHDLEMPEAERQRIRKQRSAPDLTADPKITAASEHGLSLAASGFSVETMFAEFRALRASVIWLCREQQRQAGPDELEDMRRFDEAIDETIAESLARYMREVETTRHLFFAVLGHDLRSPLGAIIGSTQFLLETARLTETERKLVAGMERSARRMIELVWDLLDLALTRLGGGMTLSCAEMDMSVLIPDVVAEAAASSPGSRVDVKTSGSLVGVWDRARLAEALSNLLGNAIQHGLKDAPIGLTVRGDEPSVVTVSVTNKGPPIPREQIGGLFEAMKGVVTGSRDRRHLGLGLYIVDKIVKAHGGIIDVRSTEMEGTTFAVSLPRRSCAA